MKLPIVSIKNVWKTYKMGEVEVDALKDITLNINQGEFIAVIGQSGSGKSTLMNLIGCLDLPTKGEIFLKNFNISKMSESDVSTLRGKTIGFIFQQYNLIQNISAFENVILPMEFLEIDDETAKKRTKKVLELVGLSKYMHHLPSQLSGGQQQRVSIARALVTEPEIILADEPTGALDSLTGEEIIKIMQKLWKEQNKTIVLVTHDLNLAKYAEKHVELKDGKIISIKENKNQKISV